MINKNVIVNGKFRSGKSFGIIMPMVDELIENNKNLLIIDKNYEYFEKYADILRKRGYEVKVLNFDSPEYSDSINILKVPYNYYKTGDKDKAYEMVSDIVEAIFPSNNLQDSFWTDASISLVRGYVLKLFELAHEDEINFLSVSRFLDILDDKNIKEVSEFLLKGDERAHRDLSSVLLAPYETRASIISVVRVAINDIVNYENSFSLISGDDLDGFFSSSNKKALFIMPKLEDSKGNIFINMILSLSYKECINKNWCFVLDNIDMIKVSNFKEIILSSIYRNIYMILGTRNIDRLLNSLGKEILDVCDVKSSDNLKIDSRLNNNFNFPKNKLPHLKKKDIRSFDLLDLMSK